ncbi:MAG TPA: DMT family transporter [Solirubrobacteraceae bacterium]|nr:DMT family transporter [Solirubrobacteraceae bacterium]
MSDAERVDPRNRPALLALASAGVLWGLTVPLSKLSLGWLGPAWLTVVRFTSAAPLLALLGRRALRDALSLRIASAGALGFGVVIVLQNVGIERTSVSHAALVVGVVPVLVALIAAGLGQAPTRLIGWGGYALALSGIALVARAGGGGSTPQGDALMLASVVLSAIFIAVQPTLLAGRDVAAVTAVQFAAGALVALPVAVLAEGVPRAPSHPVPVLAVIVLTLAGTLWPFWLFAFGQARVPAHTAGAFLNLEPVVGAAAGWFAFGDSATTTQLVGAVAVLAGIALSAAPPAVDVGVRPRLRRDAGVESHPATSPCAPARRRARPPAGSRSRRPLPSRIGRSGNASARGIP